MRAPTAASKGADAMITKVFAMCVFFIDNAKHTVPIPKTAAYNKVGRQRKSRRKDGKTKNKNNAANREYLRWSGLPPTQSSNRARRMRQNLRTRQIAKATSPAITPQPRQCPLSNPPDARAYQNRQKSFSLTAEKDYQPNGGGDNNGKQNRRRCRIFGFCR